jgi:hypothetical protein
MYIVHIDVAIPTARPATKRPRTTCSIALALAMSAAETMNPTSQHPSANLRPNGSFNPGVAAHPNIAPSGSAATTAPFIVVVSVPSTVPDSMYTNAPAMAPHAHPTLSIAKHTLSVATYSARAPAAGVGGSLKSRAVNDEDARSALEGRRVVGDDECVDAHRASQSCAYRARRDSSRWVRAFKPTPPLRDGATFDDVACARERRREGAGARHARDVTFIITIRDDDAGSGGTSDRTRSRVRPARVFAELKRHSGFALASRGDATTRRGERRR